MDRSIHLRRGLTRRRALVAIGSSTAGLVVLSACGGGGAPTAPTAAPAATSPPAPTSAAAQPAAATKAAAPTVAPTQAAAPAATVAPQAKASGTITVWGWPTDVTNSFNDTAGKSQVGPMFKKDTGIDVQYTSYDYANYNPALKTALPAGSGPDVVIVDWDAIGNLWSLTLPLDEKLKTDSVDLQSVLIPAALDEMKLIDPQRTLYLPGDMELLGWPFYWLADFQKAGVTPDNLKTFDDFQTACKAIKGSGLQPLLGSGVKGANWQYIDWFQSLVEIAAPGKIEKVQRGNGKFTDSDMVKAFSMLGTVFTQDMQQGVLGADVPVPINDFQAHKGTMTMAATGTPWFGFLTNKDTKIRDAINNSWGTFLLPQSKGLIATDAYFVGIKASKNPDAAYQFIKWSALGNGAKQIATQGGQPMAAKGIQLPQQSATFEKSLGQPLLTAIAAPNVNKFRRILSQDVYQSLSDTIPGVISGQLKPADAAAQTQQALDQSFQGEGKKWLSQ